MTTPTDPHERVRLELERVVRRWHQLPLDHALSSAPQMRELVQSLADEAAAASGMPPAAVPDLGPAVLLDQLRVMVHDLCGLGPDDERLDRLGSQLEALRGEIG